MQGYFPAPSNSPKMGSNFSLQLIISVLDIILHFFPTFTPVALSRTCELTSLSMDDDADPAGHFLLTNLLLDKMKHTARVTGIEGRIVIISSVSHVHPYKEGIRFDKINDPLRLILLI